MKTIGLIGGMSWESTTTYYQVINQTIKEKLGGLHSAKILLYSVDFEEIEKCQAEGNWEKSGEILGGIARKLENAGADFIVICTNTMHKIVDQIQEKITIPIVHIAEATADELIKQGIQTVGLLGTKYTMTQDFYKQKLMDRGIHVVIPEESEIEVVNRIIYEELCCGIVRLEAKEKYKAVIEHMQAKGAEAVILGCTEIGLLVQQEDSCLPIFDTTIIHGKKAAYLSLQK